MPAGSPPCRECGQPSSARGVRPLCGRCVARFCSRCDAALPEGRKMRICSECDRSGQKAAPRVCRQCQGSVHYTATRDLCKGCRRLFCSACDVRLPIGWKAVICHDCQHQRYEAKMSQPDRRCRECRRRPTTPKGELCSECQREVYLFTRRKMLLQGERHCARCQQRLPRGRQRVICSDCHRQDKQKQGPRLCARCGQRRRAPHISYCRPCYSMMQNWRYAYHKGDPVARLIKKIPPKIKWQQKEETA
jgi:hypothetical protein